MIRFSIILIRFRSPIPYIPNAAGGYINGKVIACGLNGNDCYRYYIYVRT